MFMFSVLFLVFWNNDSSRYMVAEDGCDNAIGGVLLQQDDDSEWHPVAYSSRRLRPEESRYTIMERETLAAIHALRVWKLYLFRPFELVTDNLGVQQGCTATQQG